VNRDPGPALADDPAAESGQGWQRLDAWLWCARFARTKALARRLVEGGRMRINRQPTGKSHARLRVGDVLTFPLGPHVRVVEVLALAGRRGPAPEARALYRDLAPPAAAHGAPVAIESPSDPQPAQD